MLYLTRRIVKALVQKSAPLYSKKARLELAAKRELEASINVAFESDIAPFVGEPYDAAPPEMPHRPQSQYFVKRMTQGLRLGLNKQARAQNPELIDGIDSVAEEIESLQEEILDTLQAYGRPEEGSDLEAYFDSSTRIADLEYLRRELAVLANEVHAAWHAGTHRGSPSLQRASAEWLTNLFGQKGQTGSYHSRMASYRNVLHDIESPEDPDTFLARNFPALPAVASSKWSQYLEAQSAVRDAASTNLQIHALEKSSPEQIDAPGAVHNWLSRQRGNAEDRLIEAGSQPNIFRVRR